MCFRLPCIVEVLDMHVPGTPVLLRVEHMYILGTPVLLRVGYLFVSGTPVVGHVDNLQRLQDICKTNNIWLHVEG